MTTETIKHTPGPWEIDMTLNGHGGFQVGPANVYAKMWGTDLPREEEWDRPENAEAVANARLIAAAPALLAALQTLVRMDNTNYERDAMRYEGAFDAARDAIEAAIGARY